MKGTASRSPISYQIRLFESFNSFKEFSKDVIRDLAVRTRLVNLEKGDILASQGGDAMSMHIVMEGRMQVTIETKEGRKSVIRKLGPGQATGLIALIAGGKQNATVQALTPATLAELSREDFEELSEQYPDTQEKLLGIVFRRLRRTHLAEVLPEYFEEMDEAIFDYIESLFEWVHINRGDSLFMKGDMGDSLYILINGLLHAVDDDKNDEEKILGAIHRGQVVGEMSLLTDEKRTASIYAVRDSDLVKLSRLSFESISEKYPQVMIAITRIVVDRLKNVRKISPLRTSAMTVAVVPVTPGVKLNNFSQMLAHAFSSYGSTVLLTASEVDRRLSKQGISKIPNHDPRAPALRAWLEEIEADHSYILFQADPNLSPWTRRCLSRADKILLLASADEAPVPGLPEQEILRDDNKRTSPAKLLVLLHSPETTIPTGTSRWLDQRDIENHYHVRWDKDRDFMRLARILADRAIGLALGGGAAKGIAHIGVIRALEEAGITIDMVGGASMGSIIAAQFAMGNNYEAMMELCERLFIRINPFNDYTLPIISLMRDRKLERMGHIAYGNNEIEDLWLTYFCVSSNLTSSQTEIHRRGSLWRAVRTSSSIPGVITPVLKDGQIYVDGGVINNLPGDIMRKECGFVIVVEVTPNLDLTVKLKEVPSPWRVLWNKIMPFKKPIQVPNILDIMLSTVLTGSFIQANSVKCDADLSLTPPLTGVGFLDFKKMKQTADIGYNYTMEVLEKLDNEDLLKSLKGL
ncbi:MAG: cyclic nucleotide-binding domain-containing protein [bacterium]|nr:cyclic nucleotide-binding domain-containing protein [bacterium]